MAKLSLPPANMPVLKLIKFNLLPLHKATAFLNPMDYLSEYTPTLTDFDPGAIPVPLSAVVNALFAPNHVRNINGVNTVANSTPRHRGGGKIVFFACFWGFL
jgi:hypothetical protein